ncbi:MAG TPA: hypothetical protein VLJ39_17245 [Tepidisphaeraceae bacterium]|nr:hypothetical protein [Tepidisphaeraceae bacterium]
MRHKLLALSLVAWILVLAPQLRADQAADDQAFFDKQTAKFVKLQPTRLTDPAVEKVFKAVMYKVNVVSSDGSSTTAVVARTGDDITIVSIPSSTAEMPDLVKLLNPEFTLKSASDGKTFQDALDAIYPIDTTFNKDDVKAKATRHKGNQWTFIRGKFFDHFKGFIVTTDAAGHVTAVKWTLDDIK